jgi:hypothetical protein
MPLNLLNLQNFSNIFKSINPENTTKTFLEKVPSEIREKISAIINRSLPLSQNQQPDLLAVRDILFVICEHLDTQEMNKIYGIFYQLCGVRNTGDPKWAENHIKDIDKIDQLLQSLERAATINTLKCWAGENENKKVAMNRILDFIKNESEKRIDLSRLELDTLPDVFMNSEIRHRLALLQLDDNRIQTFPESIGDLLELEYPNIYQRVPQRIIASYLGITPVHLSNLKKSKIYFK